MSVMLDYIIAGIVFGILAMTITRTQINLNSSLAGNTFTVITQGNAVQMAQQIESDFLKMGYKVKQRPIITQADSTSIQFYAGYLDRITLELDTPKISLSIGTTSQATVTANPYDFPFFRQKNTSPRVEQDVGMTYFYLRYYDSLDHKISTPITTTTALNNIRSIFVQFSVQSPSPVISSYDTTWSAVNWQKLIYPRNLGRKY